MSIVLPTNARNASAAAVANLVDAGPAVGRCEILSAADVLLVSFPLLKPALLQGGAGQRVADGVPISAAAVAAGVAAKMRVVDSTGSLCWSGTAGATGTDAIIDNTNIALGQTCQLTALSYTQPAGP